MILNHDALDVIREQDGPNTCFYLDPPYLHETRSSAGEYEYEMTVDDHHKLLWRLTEISGSFLISGYQSELYNDWEETYGFERHHFEIANNASSKKIKDVKTECLWTNF